MSYACKTNLALTSTATPPLGNQWNLTPQPLLVTIMLEEFYWNVFVGCVYICVHSCVHVCSHVCTNVSAYQLAWLSISCRGICWFLCYITPLQSTVLTFNFLCGIVKAPNNKPTVETLWKTCWTLYTRQGVPHLKSNNIWQ